MDTKEAIEAYIVNVINEQTGATDTTASAHLVDDLGFDSLDILELQLAVEEQYSINVPDDDCFDHTKESLKLPTPIAWAEYIMAKRPA